NQRPIESHYCRVRDGSKIVEAALIVGARSAREVEESWTGPIFSDQAAKCTRFRRAGSFGQTGYSGAFCEKFGRTKRRLAELDRDPALAVIAPHPTVRVSKNLEPFNADDGHSSLATIAFASSAKSFFSESIHRSRSRTSHSRSPSAISRGGT